MTQDGKIPRWRPGHLRRLMLALERPAEGLSTEFGAPLERVAQMHTRRGMFILLSDLLAPIDVLSAKLGLLRARGHEVLVFQILDPRELDFEFEKAAQFTDMESGRRYFIDPAAAKEEYTKQLREHLESIETICRSHGIDYYLAPTDRPLDEALFHLLTSRSRYASLGTRQNKGARSAA